MGQFGSMGKEVVGKEDMGKMREGKQQPRGGGLSGLL